MPNELRQPGGAAQEYTERIYKNIEVLETLIYDVLRDKPTEPVDSSVPQSPLLYRLMNIEEKLISLIDRINL